MTDTDAVRAGRKKVWEGQQPDMHFQWTPLGAQGLGTPEKESKTSPFTTAPPPAEGCRVRSPGLTHQPLWPDTCGWGSAGAQGFGFPFS